MRVTLELRRLVREELRKLVGFIDLEADTSKCTDYMRERLRVLREDVIYREKAIDRILAPRDE